MKKNYKGEPYPNDIKDLIEKCEKHVDYINQNFKSLCYNRDLYRKSNNQNARVPDFLEILNVNCNTKLKGTEKSLNEVKGLYVFGEVKGDVVVPVYVGISGTIFRRLYQHNHGNKHNETTLSYLMAKFEYGYNGSRKELPLKMLKEQQKKIRNYKVLVISEHNDFDLYFMEVYLAGCLRTKWNSFKTH